MMGPCGWGAGMAERDRLHRRHSSVMPANPSAHHHCLPSTPPPPSPTSSPIAPISSPPPSSPIPPFIYSSSSLPLSSAALQMSAAEFSPFLLVLLRRWCMSPTLMHSSTFTLFDQLLRKSIQPASSPSPTPPLTHRPNAMQTSSPSTSFFRLNNCPNLNY